MSISRWLTAFGALAICAGACALSLGELNVRSSVGHPFEAVLPFATGAGESIAPQCIRARDDAATANQALPYLANAQFTVTSRPGGGEIVVRTRAAVGEPAVRLRITIDCAPASILSREFVVLLDAPAAQQEPIVAPVAAVAAAEAIPPAARRARRAERRDVDAAGAAPGRQTPRNAGPAAGAPTGAALGPSLRVTPAGVQARGAAVRAPKSQARAGFRLTISRSEDDEVLQRVLSLKRSDDLLSLSMPQRELAEADRESLRAQARMALSDNPVADAIQMQTRLGALESNMGVLKKQLGEIEAARAAAEDRARRLAEENRRLAARLDTFGVIALLLLCVGLAAAGFWRYRVATERRAQLHRDWDAVAEPAVAQEPEVAPPEPVHPAGLAPVAVPASQHDQEQYARTVVLDRTASRLPPDAPPPPAPMAAPPSHAALSRPAPAPVDAKLAPSLAVETRPEDPGIAFTPANSPAAPETKAQVAPSLEVADGVIATDDGMFLPESALKKKGAGKAEVSAGAKGQSGLIEKAFGFGAEAAHDVNSNLRPTTGRGKTLPDAGLAAGVQADPYALSLPPITGRERTLSHETQAPASEAAPAAKVPVKTDTAIDFALDAPDRASLDGVTDAEAKARVEQYLGEFERKLFPEIALGRVKLDEPRSIIGLARTYYQEDFDPAKAISFLEYALHRSTDPMLIHLALLEVLRMERRVREYASVARAFRGQYPDSGTYWQLVAAYGRLLDPSDPAFEGERVPGLDLDTPSNWLGNTLDMTKYVLGQKVADSVRDLPAPVAKGAA